MIENFLYDIYRRIRRSKVAIILDVDVLSERMIEQLPILRDRLKTEVGEIKYAEIISEGNLSSAIFDKISQMGFVNKVLPSGHLELNILLESYDIALSDEVDFIVISSVREELLPLFLEMKKHVTMAIFVFEDQLPDSFVEAFDLVIYPDKVAEFNFESIDLSELDSLMPGSLDKHTNGGNELISVNGIDDVNIGTVSEDLEEESTNDSD